MKYLHSLYQCAMLYMSLNNKNLLGEHSPHSSEDVNYII